MGILKNKVTVLFLLALILRIILALLPGFKIDIDAWLAWSYRLADLGPINFYSDNIWTNYTPGFLYLLWILGIVQSIIQLPDFIYMLLLKFPGIIAEVVIGFIAIKYVIKKPLQVPFLLFFLFNPALIFNSSIWGQIDSLLTLFMLLSIILLHQKKLNLSALFFAIACLIKPQAITLAPVFLIHFLPNFNINKIAKFSGFFLSSLWILSLPFFIKDPLSGFIKLFTQMINDYPYTSLFAYNLWGSITGFWVDDQKTLFVLNYQKIGIFLLITYLCITGFLFFKKRLSILALTTLVLLSFYFLPTRVHDRYIYPALFFLIIYSFNFQNKTLIILSFLLTLINLLNLYYVYIYYNQFYLKTPMALYQPQIYNILSNNGSIISLIATFLFLTITFFILKNDVKKNNN